jgi:hypothetical protein
MNKISLFLSVWVGFLDQEKEFRQINMKSQGIYMTAEGLLSIAMTKFQMRSSSLHTAHNPRNNQTIMKAQTNFHINKNLPE